MASNLSSLLRLGHCSIACSPSRNWNFDSFILYKCTGRKFASSSSATAVAINSIQRSNEQLLVVVGAGAAGVYAAIRAKSLAPFLDVVLIEKGKPLSKVRVSGGGRCNVTNGHFADKMHLAENYPRGNKELRGSFFDIHSPVDTMSWFHQHGVVLKTEEDGRVFPMSNNSASIVDCLLLEANRCGVMLQVGKTVTNATCNVCGKFLVKIEKQTSNFVESIEADYLLIATGSSRQGYSLAVQLRHSIVNPVPSLFTFKIDDKKLTNLSGITLTKVKAKLKLDTVKRSIPQFTQVGPILVTHWGLSGPVILRLSAWGARDLYLSHYKGTLSVDFLPDFHVEDVKHILFEHRDQSGNHKISNSFPLELSIVKRFWRYLLEREGLEGDILWASISNKSLTAMANLLKHCSFNVNGKGQFKDEFVTAGGVPLPEISIETMESKIVPHLFFAGEVLNVDGVTGGFNFQNAWSGGYIAGTRIGELASEVQRATDLQSIADF